MKLITPFLIGVASLITFSPTAEASSFPSSFEFDLIYLSGDNPDSSGKGAYLPDFSLVPGICGNNGFVCNDNNELDLLNATGIELITEFNLTISGLSGISDISFNQSDLTGFSLLIDRLVNFRDEPLFDANNAFGYLSSDTVEEEDYQTYLTVNFFNGSSTTYTLGTTSSIPIPEPLTLLGSLTAIGFGSFFKREISKKQKKEDLT